MINTKAEIGRSQDKIETYSIRITDLEKKWFVHRFHFGKITKAVNSPLNKLLYS